MNRLLLTVVLLVALYSPAVSQPDLDPEDKSHLRYQIDSLQKKIKIAKEDSILVRDLSLLSNCYNNFWYDSALLFARRAVQLAEKLKYPSSLILGFQYLAQAFQARKNYDSSNFYAKKALDICIENNLDSEELHNFRAFLNNNFFLQGNYTEAMKISTEGLAKAEKINNRERMAHYNSVLGYIMMKLENFEQSRRYYSIELQLTRQIKNKEAEASALLNLADLSKTEKKLPEAIPYIRDALIIYQAYIPERDTKFAREAYAYDKLAGVYKLMQNNNDALRNCLIAIDLTQKPLGNQKRLLGNRYDIAAYFINAGDIYNRLQKPDSALFYLRQGLAIAKIIIHREDLRDAYEQLSISFAKIKKFDSAYVYGQFFTKLKDSIVKENSQKDILQRDADLQIERQRRIQQAELSRQQRWRNIIIGISIFAIGIIIMMYNRRRIKQKILYQQQLNKQQNEMFNLTATVQEKERKRIAEDIHDGLGSVLSAAKLKLSSLEEDKRSLTEEQREKYQATLFLLDEAAAELRNISHNIMPATLSKLGLIAALKNITDRISSHSGLQLQLETHGFDNRLEESAEISLYRIVLELLNNIVKHAQASKAVVQLIKYPGYINITVEDNGKGFDYKKIVSLNKGIGLGNIESRVNYLRGTIDVDSLPGRGTVTIIDIPYSAEFLKYQDVGIKND